MAILQRHKNSIYGLAAELTALNQAVSNETSRASGVETTLDGRITSEVATLNTSISAETTRATNAEAALQQAINNILTNADVTALNSLAEIVAAFQDADSTINGAITTLSNNAMQKAMNLNDVADKAAARTNLDVYSKTEVDALTSASGGGNVIRMESLVIASGAVTLTYPPINGISGVLNFGTVRYTDANSVAYDAPLVATGNSSVFNVSTDTAGQWDGLTVQVQYAHAPV